MTIEIVDLPIKKMVMFHSTLLVSQRVIYLILFLWAMAPLALKLSWGDTFWWAGKLVYPIVSLISFFCWFTLTIDIYIYIIYIYIYHIYIYIIYHISYIIYIYISYTYHIYIHIHIILCVLAYISLCEYVFIHLVKLREVTTHTQKKSPQNGKCASHEPLPEVPGRYQRFRPSLGAHPER